MDVGQICTPDVITVTPQTTIAQAAARMRAHNVGSLVVVNGDLEPTGIITDRDIVVGVIAQDAGHLDQVTVGDWVDRPLVTCRDTDALMWAAWRMRDERIRRLPVIDARSKLVGILALDDVLGVLVEQLDDLVGVIRGQPPRERVGRG